MKSTHRRSLIAAAISIAGLALCVPASSQAAPITIGALDPNPNGGALGCNSGRAFLQGTTGGSVSYDVGIPGSADTPVVVTQWATASRAGGPAALKVLSRDAVGDPDDNNPADNNELLTDTVLATSAVQNLVAGVNRFNVRIPAPGGGEIGFHVPSGGAQKCFFPSPVADPQDKVMDGLTAGELGTSFQTDTGRASVQLNLQVTFEPDADADGFGDDTQDPCPGAQGLVNGCPVPVLPPPPPPDVTKPVLAGGLKFSRSTFAAAKSGAAFSAQKGKKKKAKKPSAPVGTKVSFTLSEAAAVAFKVERKTSGRRDKGKCKTATRKLRKKPKCTLWKKVTGSFTFQGKAGANSFTFRGRMGGKALGKGDYRLIGTATDAARNVSAPTNKSFKIVK